MILHINPVTLSVHQKYEVSSNIVSKNILSSKTVLNINIIKKCFLSIKSACFNNITDFHCFYCILYQINAGLLSIRDFFQKHLKKNLLTPKPFQKLFPSLNAKLVPVASCSIHMQNMFFCFMHCMCDSVFLILYLLCVSVGSRGSPQAGTERRVTGFERSPQTDPGNPSAAVGPGAADAAL